MVIEKSQHSGILCAVQIDGGNHHNIAKPPDGITLLIRAPQTEVEHGQALVLTH